MIVDLVVRELKLPLFDEESILNEYIDDKENKPLYNHGKDITTCDVPTKRIFH